MSHRNRAEPPAVVRWAALAVSLLALAVVAYIAITLAWIITKVVWL